MKEKKERFSANGETNWSLFRRIEPLFHRAYWVPSHHPPEKALVRSCVKCVLIDYFNFQWLQG
jgi:hypothetical protein